MEQQTVKDTIHILGMEVGRIQFYTGIAIAIVGGAISTARYFIDKKLKLK
jgi:hypothetical protein